MKSHRQFVAEQIEKNPEFAEELARARVEVNFAIDLVQLRESRCMTQEALAKQAGVKQPMIARYEKGQIPKVETLQRLARTLDARIVLTPDKIEFLPNPRRKKAVTKKPNMALAEAG